MGFKLLLILTGAAAATGGCGKVDIPGGRPFNGALPSIPGLVEAENYDEGGEGVAYHDLDAGNNGGVYRSDDVDIRPKPAASNGFSVFNAYPGEYLNYSILVTQAGSYTIEALASYLGSAGGNFHFEIDGVDVTGPISVGQTSGWGDFQPFGKSGVALSAGYHVLRLSLDTGGAAGVVGDFDAIRFTLVP